MPTPVTNALATEILRRAIAGGALPGGDLPDWDGYRAFRRHLRGCLDLPETSVPSLTAQILYGISYVVRPPRVLAIGTDPGNALVWLIGPGFTRPGVYKGERAVGVDTDDQATRWAPRHWQALGCPEVEMLSGDGHTAPASLRDQWDLVFLDVEHPRTGRRMHAGVLEAVYPWVRSRGLILMHDAGRQQVRHGVTEERARVGNPDWFDVSVPLEVDDRGLELSVKVGPAGVPPPLACRVCGML